MTSATLDFERVDLINQWGSIPKEVKANMANHISIVRFLNHKAASRRISITRKLKVSVQKHLRVIWINLLCLRRFLFWPCKNKKVKRSRKILSIVTMDLRKIGNLCTMTSWTTSSISLKYWRELKRLNPKLNQWEKNQITLVLCRHSPLNLLNSSFSLICKCQKERASQDSNSTKEFFW